jgi:hypothetical protein
MNDMQGNRGHHFNTAKVEYKVKEFVTRGITLVICSFCGSVICEDKQVRVTQLSIGDFIFKCCHQVALLFDIEGIRVSVMAPQAMSKENGIVWKSERSTKTCP